jgi:hypothetical protein
MGVQLRNTGKVYNSGGTQTGTYTATTDAGFQYDDNPSGIGGNDKGWDWNAGYGGYIHPPGANMMSATCRVIFTATALDEAGNPIAWSWQEWCRGDSSYPWPTQPTATGTTLMD